MNMKAILIVMNTTRAVVKIRPERKNIQACMGLDRLICVRYSDDRRPRGG